MTTNETRFRRLYSDHAAVVYRFALRRAGPDLADDVLADTFLVAWRRIDQIPADRERAWLVTTARWVLTDVSRSGRRRDSLLGRLPRPRPQPDPAPSVADAVDVHRALATLSATDQEVLRLIEWDQLTHREAAAVVGCGVAALSVRLRRARARFARALTDGSGPVARTASTVAGSTTPSPSPSPSPSRSHSRSMPEVRS